MRLAMDKVAASLEQSSPGALLVIIHGAARGADSLAGQWGKSKGLPVVEIPANWDVYGNAAGSIRNQWMRDICMPTYGVGFPGGRGSANMLAKLLEVKCPVWLPERSEL